MAFTVKLAQYADMAECARVEYESLPNYPGYLSDAWHYFQSQKGACVCVYDGNEMIGIGRFTVHNVLSHLAVREKATGLISLGKRTSVLRAHVNTERISFSRADGHEMTIGIQHDSSVAVIDIELLIHI